MAEYKPDRWVIVKIGGKDPHYRVLGGWSGGYLDSDYWRMNSGITKVDFDGDYWYFYGSSNSLYKCYVDNYGYTAASADIYANYKNIYGDDFEDLKDQEWNTEDWDWIIE